MYLGLFSSMGAEPLTVTWGAESDAKASLAKLQAVRVRAQQLKVLRPDWDDQINWLSQTVGLQISCYSKGGRWDSANNMCAMYAPDIGQDPVKALQMTVNSMDILFSQINVAVKAAEQQSASAPEESYPSPSGGGYVSQTYPESSAYPTIGTPKETVSTTGTATFSPGMRQQIQIQGPIPALTTPGAGKKAATFSWTELLKLVEAGMVGYANVQKQQAAAQLMAVQQSGKPLYVDPTTEQNVKATSPWLYATIGIVALGVVGFFLLKD